MNARASFFAARLIGGVIIGAPLLSAPANAASFSLPGDATIDVVGIRACTTVGCTDSNGQSAATGSGTADSFAQGAVDFVPPAGTALFDIETESSSTGISYELSEQGTAPLDVSVGAN